MVVAVARKLSRSGVGVPLTCVMKFVMPSVYIVAGEPGTYKKKKKKNE